MRAYGPAVTDDVQYEYTSAQAIRGTEAKVIAKRAEDGWEVDSRNQGLLRTELTFRRVKPTTPGARLLATFRRLEPQAQRRLVAASGVLLLLVIVGGIVAGTLAGGGTPAPVAAASETGAEATTSEEPSESAVPAPETTAPATASTVPVVEETLTVENNEDLAALVALDDPGAAAVAEFAAEYRGRTIEFEGNIAAMANHGGYATRYDVLVLAGDYSETSAAGPQFKFEDVNFTIDMNVTGPDIPDTIGVGDNLRVVARVGGYNATSQLFILDPVRTEVR